MNNTTFLTNQEIIAQLSLRDDLTDLNLDLLDRLARAEDELDRLLKSLRDAQAALSANGASPPQE